MRTCCVCGEEAIYKQLIVLPVTVFFEHKRYRRMALEPSDEFICHDCLQEEAENIFALL